MKNIPKVTLKRPPAGSLRPGHPWIYKSQLKEVGMDVLPGSLVDVVLTNDRFVGRGYYNPRSEIAVRLLTRNKEEINKDFFKQKIEKAIRYREAFVRGTNAFRFISSEADGLPGFIVDQYGDAVVVQFLTLGAEHLKPVFLQALEETVDCKGIYERSDSASRKIEGLEDRVGWIKQECAAEIEIYEGDVHYKLHFGEGHKTGFYLDQRENRIQIGELGVKGEEVLDAFCYTGGFGLHLAKKGCRVLGIDAQKEVIQQAEENRKLNNLSEENLRFKVANVFDELKNFEAENKKFSLVVLDPPSFVKRKDALEGAIAGYKEIILRSMKILKEDGLLAVFSCAYHLDESILMQTSQSAAWDVKKSLHVVRFMKQSVDHPIDPFIPETYYLKGFLFQVSSQ